MDAFETIRDAIDNIGENLSQADYLDLLEKLRDEIETRLEIINSEIERGE